MVLCSFMDLFVTVTDTHVTQRRLLSIVVQSSRTFFTMSGAIPSNALNELWLLLLCSMSFRCKLGRPGLCNKKSNQPMIITLVCGKYSNSFGLFFLTRSICRPLYMIRKFVKHDRYSSRSDAADCRIDWLSNVYNWRQKNISARCSTSNHRLGQSNVIKYSSSVKLRHLLSLEFC